MKQDETTSKLVSSRPYRGLSLEQLAPRAGSLDIFKNPSRFNNTLRYPDGRQVLLRVFEVLEGEHDDKGKAR